MKDKSVQEIVSEMDAGLAHAKAHTEALKAAGDVEKAKAALLWIGAMWLFLAPPVGYITWLVIR